MGVKFMCITEKEKSRTFYVNSDNEEIRSTDNTNDAINKLIESFLSNYQKEKQVLRNISDYTYDSVDMLGIHFHDIKLKRGKSYIESPKWSADKKVIINPKNTKDKSVQYAITVALNHREIGKNPQRISKISIIGKIQIFLQEQMNIKNLKKTIIILHLIFLYHTIKKK